MANPFEETDAVEALSRTPSPLTPDTSTHRLATYTTSTPFPDQRSASEEPSAVVGSSKKTSLDAVAKLLLDESFILSALEFHTELLESGRSLRRLNEFFTNPVNFEHVSAVGSLKPASFNLQRTASSATFDSLDFTHGSETDYDQKNEDRFAVLEFELRKARETISQLRAQLTSASEEQQSHPFEPGAPPADPDSSRPSVPPHHQTSTISCPPPPARVHERRAVNFLVHEYLLTADYKLSSVTFSEEAADQDFEDWDDVGLNVPRPSDLLALYREFVHSNVWSSRVAGVDQSTSCDDLAPNLNSNSNLSANQRRADEDSTSLSLSKFDDENNSELDLDMDMDTLVNRLNCENNRLYEQNNELNEQIEALRADIVQLKSRLHQVQSSSSNNNGGGVANKPVNIEISQSVSNQSPSQSVSHSRQPSVVPLSPVVPLLRTRFEMERHMNNSFNARMQPLIGLNASRMTADIRCHLDAVLAEPSKMASLSAQLLPRIVPHLLLNKRSEVVPLLLAACILTESEDPPHASAADGNSNSNAKNGAKTDETSTQLLSELFNLIKKPDDEQRRLLTGALVYFAAHVGATRTETQLLPLCWEQMTHKHDERRLLVVETCGAIAPYLPPSLLSSLVLSMLQQMLFEDKSVRVREVIVRSLASVCLYVEDTDKFNQFNELTCRVLLDANDGVVASAQHTLLPVLAFWASQSDRLQQLVDVFVTKLTQLFTVSGSSQSANSSLIALYIGCLNALTPVIFHYVISTADCRSESPDPVDVSTRFPPSTAGPTVQDLAESPEDFSSQLSAYDAHTKPEWFKSWPTLDYVAQKFLPSLLSVVSRLDVTHPRLLTLMLDYVETLCLTFGRGFVHAKVIPLFKTYVTPTSNEDDVANDAGNNGNNDATQQQQQRRSSIATTTNQSRVDHVHASLPVYCVAVLSVYGQPSDWSLCEHVLAANWLKAAERHVNSGAASSSNVIAVACSRLFERRPAQRDRLLQFVCEYLTHPEVAARHCLAEVLSSLVPYSETGTDCLRRRLLPALVTLSGDQNASVRASTCVGLLALAERVNGDSELMEKTRVQLSSLFADSDLSVCMQLVRCVAQAAPNLETNFRDRFILSELCQLAQRTSTLPSTDPQRSATAECLFEAYSALSCCFLSATAVATYLLPGMRHLLQTLDPQHVKIANSILKDAEAKLNQATPASSGNASYSTHQQSTTTASSDSYSSSTNATSSVSGQYSSSRSDVGHEDGAVSHRMFGAFRDIKDRVDTSHMSSLFRKKT